MSPSAGWRPAIAGLLAFRGPQGDPFEHAGRQKRFAGREQLALFEPDVGLELPGERAKPSDVAGLGRRDVPAQVAMIAKRPVHKV